MSLEVDIHKKLSGFELHVRFATDSASLGILGASGCGKSMTLKSIAGIVTPDRGRIVLNGRVLFDSEGKINLPPQKRRVGYLFQHYALFPNMTVAQNIGAGLKKAGKGLVGKGRVGKKEGKERIREIARLFDIEELCRRYPCQLSGGQQQRVALARILAYEPEVLLLDEPFSALDSYLKERLQVELLRLLKLYRGEILMVSHSQDEIYRFCEHALILDRGNCITQGNTKDLFENPGYLEAARLTGCKNLVRVKVEEDGSLTALDWGLSFRSAARVSERGGIKGLGIRASRWKPGFGPVPARENVLPVSEPVVAEGPFEVHVILRRKSAGREGVETIWWKIGKEEWRRLLEEKGMPSYLEISPEDVMLLR